MLYLGSCRCQPEWPGGRSAWTSQTGLLITSRVVVQPSFEPLTLEEVKTAHRIDEDIGDDAYLLSLIRAAREYVERYLGQSLVQQTREADYAFYDSTWPASMLPFGPVRSVESITGEAPYAVRYLAGYEPWEPVPDSITTAMQLLIGDWHENREQTIVGKNNSQLPIAVKALLDFYRQRLGIA